MVSLPISFRITSLALGQSYDCPSANEVTLKDMGKINQLSATTQHDQASTMCICHEMFCRIFIQCSINRQILVLTETKVHCYVHGKMCWTIQVKPHRAGDNLVRCCINQHILVPTKKKVHCYVHGKMCRTIQVKPHRSGENHTKISHLWTHIT